MSLETITLAVGGIPYTLALSDIRKHPNSFLECMVKKEWSESAKTVDRDGYIFKFISAYLVCGRLPRDSRGLIDVDDATLLRIKEEAEFFGLLGLVKECDLPSKDKSPTDVMSYMTIRKYISYVKDMQGDKNGAIVVENDLDPPSELVECLSELYAPFCLTGTVNTRHFVRHFPRLFKKSSFQKPVVEELLAEATQSAFGRGLETVTDTTVRNSFEIDASKLNPEALRAIRRTVRVAALAPHLRLEIRPYKLVIYKEGGHFDAHRDTVRGEGHIGTLVFILNSEYTGGELEVSHCGRTESVTGAYSWVAMYGDCLHKINPVTSGTRVSLIYDIYGTSRWEDAPKDVTAEPSFIQTQGSHEDANSEGEKQDDNDDEEEEGKGSDVSGDSANNEENQEAESEEEEKEENGSEVGNSSEEGEHDDDESDYLSKSTDDPVLNWLDSSTTQADVSLGARCRGMPQQERTESEIDGDALQNRIMSALDDELGVNGEAEDTYGAVIVALQHLYPVSQTSPAFLKGADRALYDLLHQYYEVTVVAATIYREHHPCLSDKIVGSLFTPALLDRALNRSAYKTAPTAATTATSADSSDEEDEAEEAPTKKQRTEPALGNPVSSASPSCTPRPVKLVISARLDEDALLDYTPYLEETGNESQSEESVYLVAGLQVQVRTKG